MPYDVEAIRRKVKQTMTGRVRDPDEFKPNKATSTVDPICYRYFILPPLELGQACKGGKASKSMEGQYFIKHAAHWIDNKPYPCPRVCSGEDCELCSFGFELMKDDKVKNDKDAKSRIRQQWMPSEQYAMNIFFTGAECNPEDLRNQVKYHNAPKAVIDRCNSALMRDDAGDPDKPMAHGVFYDEGNAYVFELRVLQNGSNNGYATSDFLAINGSRPMIMTQDRKADLDKITAMLAQRIDLFTKIEAPDPEKIKRIADKLINGNDEPRGGFDEDETKKTVATTKPGATTTRRAAPVSEGLANEAPLADKPKPAAEPAKSVKPVQQVVSTDVGDDEIDSLISQMKDED